MKPDLLGLDGVRRVFPVVPVAPDFMQPHPETVTWWQQREKCRRCVHYMPPVDTRDRGGERCRIVLKRVGGSGRGRHMGSYCIDARSSDGACGPRARLFVAARKVTR